jgi:hypothetical protein
MTQQNRFCPGCGFQLTGSMQFCPKCGGAVPELPQAPVPQPLAEVAPQQPVPVTGNAAMPQQPGVLPPPPGMEAPAPGLAPPPPGLAPPPPGLAPPPPVGQMPAQVIPGTITDETPIRLDLTYGKKVHMNIMGFLAIWMVVTGIMSTPWVKIDGRGGGVTVSPGGYKFCHRGDCKTLGFDAPGLNKLNEPLAAIGGFLFIMQMLAGFIIVGILTFLQYGRMTLITYRKLMKIITISNWALLGMSVVMMTLMFAGWSSPSGKSPDVSPDIYGIIIIIGMIASPIAMRTWRQPPLKP